MSRFELEEALRQQGCAVCRLVELAGSSYLEYLLYDLVNDPDVQKEFRASLGLCGSHVQWMLEKGDGLGVAILYRAVVKELLGLLSKPSDAPSELRRIPLPRTWVHRGLKRKGPGS